MPVIFNVECKDVLSKTNLMGELTVNQRGFESKQIFYHELFTPRYHILPTNPKNDLNIYPVIGDLLRPRIHA